MNHRNIKTQHRLFFLLWIPVVLLAIASLVIIEYFTLAKENRIKAYQSSEVLITELEHTIAQNKLDTAQLYDFLEKIYGSKAKTATRIIDADESLERSQKSLKTLADFLDVDAIYLYDESGTIYSGSDSSHFGLSMEKGGQLSYFLPMLRDKELVMCQSITPNSSDAQSMMYAMCWNESGRYMLQVGILADRLPELLQVDQIKKIVSNIPKTKKQDILVTLRDQSTIIASTSPSYLGRSLEELSIHPQQHPGERHFQCGSPGQAIYCSCSSFGNHRLVIAQYQKYIDENIPITLVTFTEYLALIFIIMTFLMDYMNSRLLAERSNALQDQLTGLFNRREYENVLLHYESAPLEADLVFLSMDLNGLKYVNDHYGHSSGDLLLQGAAQSMKQAFGSNGKVFRVGGDEFAAILFANAEKTEEMQRDFRELLGKWSQKNKLDLSVSIGCIPCEEHPGLPLQTLAKLADEAMYQDKARYYAASGKDRRER